MRVESRANQMSKGDESAKIKKEDGIQQLYLGRVLDAVNELGETVALKRLFTRILEEGVFKWLLMPSQKNQKVVKADVDNAFMSLLYLSGFIYHDHLCQARVLASKEEQAWYKYVMLKRQQHLHPRTKRFFEEDEDQQLKAKSEFCSFASNVPPILSPP